MRIANLRQAFDQRNLCPLGPRKFRTQANSESRSILFEHGGSSIYSILLSTWQSNLIILVIDFSLGRHPCLCQPLIRLFTMSQLCSMLLSKYLVTNGLD